VQTGLSVGFCHFCQVEIRWKRNKRNKNLWKRNKRNTNKANKANVVKRDTGRFYLDNLDTD